MNLSDLFGNVGDALNEVGSRIRYGVSPAEKYNMMAQRKIPGMPSPWLSSGEENPEATRYASNYLGTKQWGSGLAQGLNAFRNFVDPDQKVYEQGLKGQQAAEDESNNFVSSLFGDD